MLGKKKKQKEEVFDEQISGEEAARHLNLLRDVLENTQANIKKALNIINQKEFDPEALLDSLERTKEASSGFVVTNGNDQSGQQGTERIIEGVFNGEKMVAGDGAEFNVPANYASKSKLLEGDILKLTISKDGSFIYKQIGPVPRKQLVAELAQNEKEGEWYALEGKKRWKLLTASVTYFHGQPGDEVVILVPKEGDSDWAAVENIIKNSNR